jgi:hypothetical protein
MARPPQDPQAPANPQLQELAGLSDIVKVLRDWSESSWGRAPPAIGICRQQIAVCSAKIARILSKLAAAQGAREAAWLELFKANDDPRDKLRNATDAGAYPPTLDDDLKADAKRSEEAEDALARAETIVTWWRGELARVEGKKREYEFWREYHLTKDESEQFAFRCSSESGGGYSTTELQKMEERIRRINRSLPPGFKPIPSINVQTIMYVPSSVPGRYLPLRP